MIDTVGNAQEYVAANMLEVEQGPALSLFEAALLVQEGWNVWVLAGRATRAEHLLDNFAVELGVPLPSHALSSRILTIPRGSPLGRGTAPRGFYVEPCVNPGDWGSTPLELGRGSVTALSDKVLDEYFSCWSRGRVQRFRQFTSPDYVLLTTLAERLPTQACHAMRGAVCFCLDWPSYGLGIRTCGSASEVDFSGTFGKEDVIACFGS
jgi:hypothetical protein